MFYELASILYVYLIAIAQRLCNYKSLDQLNFNGTVCVKKCFKGLNRVKCHMAT